MSDPIYQPRVPIFPRSVKGRFRNIKFTILVLAYGTYFLLPWLRWDRPSGPDQAVLFDLVGRRFYLFDLVVYAQDIFWLAGVLVIFTLLLFFVTGLAGRVWCGYFCFQTLWTDVFMLVERWVQGDRNARIKLAKSPWTAGKLARMGSTWGLWLLVSLLTGLSFTLYWGNAPQLLVDMLHGEAPFAAYATTAFLAATTFVMAGLAREQVCTYMCPYARFQSVMFDRDTSIVAYDEVRGEREQGRRKPAKGLMNYQERINSGVGDCIDCGYCVQVCPVGIDIRNGLQYQCISCALCIDACNTIMASINYPVGLIRYSSENELEGKQTHRLNLKNLGYALVLVVTTGLLVWSILTRSAFELNVRQIRQPLSVTLSDGRIQNRYEIKINNKTDRQYRFRLTLEGLEHAELDTGNFRDIVLLPEHTIQINAKIRMQPEYATARREAFRFVLQALDSGHVEPVSHESMFYVPTVSLK
ncbi:MAG: cytochrome c oxidase accessory protein CcoG [Proteobacteria bacterium]|jgi:cytochrome c oxidase accessory protein FixG|nr:cytochrome c oxidase accessory protein CcoG [Pseudomonadota bacterium]